MTHRFLPDAAAEVFAGTTPEQVRADLATMDAGWQLDGEPGTGGPGRGLPDGASGWVQVGTDGYGSFRPQWVVNLDDHLDRRLSTNEVFWWGLRYLADQTAAMVEPSLIRVCRCGHPEDDHLWPTCWECNRRSDGVGESFACDNDDEDCDCDGFKPIADQAP